MTTSTFPFIHKGCSTCELRDDICNNNTQTNSAYDLLKQPPKSEVSTIRNHFFPQSPSTWVSCGQKGLVASTLVSLIVAAYQRWFQLLTIIEVVELLWISMARDEHRSDSLLDGSIVSAEEWRAGYDGNLGDQFAWSIQHDMRSDGVLVKGSRTKGMGFWHAGFASDDSILNNGR